MKSTKSCIGLYSVLTLFATLLVVGCATTASLRPTSADGILGTPRYYHYPNHLVFQVAQEAARELGLTIAESAPDQSYFIAQRGMAGLDWGNLVGVYFTAATDNSTLVVIRTEPRFAANIATKDLTTALHVGIRSKLKAQQDNETDAS